jgi:hypothetical protein
MFIRHLITKGRTGSLLACLTVAVMLVCHGAAVSAQDWKVPKSFAKNGDAIVLCSRPLHGARGPGHPGCQLAPIRAPLLRILAVRVDSCGKSTD